MSASLVFQTGLLYEELREAFLQQKYAVVLTSDFKEIIWSATPLKDSTTIFDALNSKTIFSDSELATLQSGSSVDLFGKGILIKPFFNFAKLVEDNSVLSRENLDKLTAHDAVLLLGEDVEQPKIADLLYALENSNIAAAIITNNGAIVSSLTYEGYSLGRKLLHGFDTDNINIIATIFLKLKNILCSTNFMKFSANTVIHKSFNDFLFSCVDFRFNNITYFLVILDLGARPQQEEAFDMIAKFLRKNCDL